MKRRASSGQDLLALKGAAQNSFPKSMPKLAPNTEIPTFLPTVTPQPRALTSSESSLIPPPVSRPTPRFKSNAEASTFARWTPASAIAWVPEKDVPAFAPRKEASTAPIGFVPAGV